MEPTPAFRWEVAGGSIKGPHREENQDAFFVGRRRIAVFDGVGRHVRGRQAAQAARDAFAAARTNLDMASLDDEAPSKAQAGDRIVACTDGVHGVISRHELTRQLRTAKAHQAVATTLDLVLARGAPDNATLIAAHATATGGRSE